MTIKLIASDLDGTLLNDQCEISARTKEAVRRAREMGVVFTLATGRMYCSALPFALELGIDVPLITYQGALVKTSISKEVIYHRPLPMELAKEIISIGEKEKYNINVYLNDQIFIHRETEMIRDYSRTVKVPYTVVEDLSLFLDQDPTKVLFIGEEEPLVSLWGKLNKKFENQAYITKSSPHFLEFTHPKANKGEGILAIAQSLGIKKEEIMAFGDNFNDIELLGAAGIAVAMGNARAELKEKADLVTGTNVQDGVADAIEKFVLNHK